MKRFKQLVDVVLRRRPRTMQPAGYAEVVIEGKPVRIPYY